MALFGKDERVQRPEGGDLLASDAPAPMPQVASEPAAQTHLAKGSRVEGKLTFEGSVNIDGVVAGEIEAQHTVVIGEGAVVDAQINAEAIIVKGKVSGDLTARKQVELRAPAKLVGNITTPSLVIHEGVLFEGHCSMGGTEARTERPDRKVALFPKEERSNTNTVRMSSEAAK